jgi:DNA-binding transcriptional regulator LsrR (DeoR family)
MEIDKYRLGGHDNERRDASHPYWKAIVDKYADGKGMSMPEIAAELGISKQRVSQILKHAKRREVTQ